MGDGRRVFWWLWKRRELLILRKHAAWQRGGHHVAWRPALLGAREAEGRPNGCGLPGAQEPVVTAK